MKTENNIELNEWFEAETHEDAVDMMVESAVVPFGTAMWAV